MVLDISISPNCKKSCRSGDENDIEKVYDNEIEFLAGVSAFLQRAAASLQKLENKGFDIRTDDGMIKGKIAFHRHVLCVTRQGF